MQKLLAAASSTAVDRLAKFAADITTAFNQLIGKNAFADLSSFRAVAQVVFAEASRVLSSDVAAPPRAMLTSSTQHLRENSNSPISSTANFRGVRMPRWRSAW